MTTAFDAKARRLKLSAASSAELLGHKLRRFKRYDTRFHTDCIYCGLGVTVTPYPAPNETHIMGSAVAINCQSPKS